MNKKVTKRALFLSFASMFLCFTMLLGTTYAWFTDSVNSGINQIVAGNLDVELYHTSKTVADAKVDGETKLFRLAEDHLWEPGAMVYEKFTVKNEGDLALKYQFALNVANATTVGDVAFTDLLKVAVVDDTFNYDRASVNGITAWNTLSTFVLDGELDGKTDATKSDTFGIVIYWEPSDQDNLFNFNNGNNDVVSVDVGVNLFATQMEAELDSFGSAYDKDAVYADTYVKSANELVDAISEGGIIALMSDIAITSPITVDGDVVIDLNGYEIDASGMTGDALGRPFHMAEGASLTINAGDAEVALGGHGLVNVPGDVKNANITINGGRFIGSTQSGTLIRLRNGNENVNIVLNDVIYEDNSNSGYIVSTQGFEYTGAGTLTVNGGSYAANYGFQIYALNATLNGVEIKTSSTAVEASGDVNTGRMAKVTVENCDITAGNAQVENAPGAGVAASHGATLTVKNSTISGNAKVVYHVYNSGGYIVAENNNIDGATYTTLAKNDLPSAGSITIDGVAVQ